jgi:prepilin-type N-terminal cleavage/methylation domain-containing protein
MKTHNLKNGFTLVEVIVASFIFGTIVAGVSSFSAYYLKNYSFSTEENQSIGIAQTGLTEMIRNIREIRDGEDGSWPLVQTDNNLFIFYSDVTGDGKADRVRYFINGTTLQKGIIQPTAVPVTYPAGNEKIYTIVTNIDTSAGPIFTYYNGNWPSDLVNNPITPTNRIYNTRYIKVLLKINITANYAALPFELTSGVAIRSMKDNL